MGCNVCCWNYTQPLLPCFVVRQRFQWWSESSCWSIWWVWLAPSQGTHHITQRTLVNSFHALVCPCNEMANDMVSSNMHSVFHTRPIREALCFLGWQARHAQLQHGTSQPHLGNIKCPPPIPDSKIMSSTRRKWLSSIPTRTRKMALSSSGHRNLSFCPWRKTGSHPVDTRP